MSGRIPVGDRPARCRPDLSARQAGLLLGIVLACGTALRYGAFCILQPAPESDYLQYFQMASLVADGRTMQSRETFAYMSGGYPLLLGAWFRAFGKSAHAGHLLNLALYGVSALGLYGAAVALTGRRVVGLVCAALCSAYVESIVYATYLAKENLLVAILALHLWLMTAAGAGRSARIAALASGALLGAAVIAGTAYAAFAPALVLAMWLKSRRPGQWAAQVLAFALAAALVLAPWMLRNERLLGRPLVATNGGFNLYIGNNPAATGEFVSITDTPAGEQFQRLLRERGEVAATEFLGEQAVGFMRERPARALRLALYKLALFWNPPLHQGSGRPHAAESLVRGVWTLQYALLALLSTGAAVVAVRRRAPLALPLIALPLGYWLLHGAFFVTYRFRLTVMPVLLLGAALAAGWVVARAGAAQVRRVRAGPAGVPAGLPHAAD